MTTITDEYMYEMMPKTKEYTIVLLKPGPKADQPGVENMILGTRAKEFCPSC